MQISRLSCGWAVAAGISLLLGSSMIVKVGAQSQGGDKYANRKWQAEMPDQPAEQDQKKGKKHPVVSFMKGVGKELATSADYMGKDMVLLFSVQDVDPYEKKAPTNRPYELLTFRLIDGSRASLIKYPDGSGRIEGSFADGTVIIPTSDREFLVKYPNGAKGRLVKTGSDIKVYRPDKTVTTFKKGMSGGYSVSNNKLGYWGEAVPDRTGLRNEDENYSFLFNSR